MSNNKFSFSTLGSKLDKIALKSKNLITIKIIEFNILRNRLFLVSQESILFSKYENIFDDDEESTQDAGKRRIRKTRKTRKTYKSRTRKPRKPIKSKKSRRRSRSRKPRKVVKSSKSRRRKRSIK